MNTDPELTPEAIRALRKRLTDARAKTVASLEEAHRNMHAVMTVIASLNETLREIDTLNIEADAKVEIDAANAGHRLDPKARKALVRVAGIGQRQKSSCHRVDNRTAQSYLSRMSSVVDHWWPRMNPSNPPETMTVEQLYDGDLPDENELLWSHINPNSTNKPFRIVTVDPVEIYKTWTVDGAGTTVAEAYRDHANKDQKRFVAELRKSKRLADEIVVIDDKDLVDGFHRIVAMALNKVRSARALDLSEPIDADVARENPSRQVTKRDVGLASVAKDKTLSPIGQWPWHQNERIERTQYEDIELYGEPQQVVLIWTTSENALGARKNGRLLIASNENANYIGAGAFFIEEYGRKCIQSVWVEPEYRQSMRHVRTGEPPGVDFGSILADMAKRDGIVCILKPISKAGAAWAKRHGLRVRA